MADKKKPNNYDASGRKSVRTTVITTTFVMSDAERARYGLPPYDPNEDKTSIGRRKKPSIVRGDQVPSSNSADYITPPNANDTRSRSTSTAAGRDLTPEEKAVLSTVADSTPVDAPESYKVTPIALGSPFDTQIAAEKRAAEIIAGTNTPAPVESRTDPGLNREKALEELRKAAENIDYFERYIGPYPHYFIEQDYQVLYHDVKIWIQGTDVSAWLEGQVQVRYNTNTDPNTLDFTLNNAGNRFILTPENLSGKWRTATHSGINDYDESAKYNIFKLKSMPSLNHPDKASGGLVYPLNHWGCIFHKMDPIRAWIRNPAARLIDGQLADEWLPLFTGYITSFPKSENFINGATSIQIHAEDIRTIIKDMRVNTNTTMYTTKDGGEVVSPTTSEAVPGARLTYHPNVNKQFDQTFFKDLLVYSRAGDPWVDLTLPELVEALTFNEDAQVVINGARNRRAAELESKIKETISEINKTPRSNASKRAELEATLANLQKEKKTNYSSEVSEPPDRRNHPVRSRMGRMQRGFFRGATGPSPVYPDADNRQAQIDFLQNWYSLCVFGSKTRGADGLLTYDFDKLGYWSSADIERVGKQTATTFPWAPDAQAVHMIEPGTASTALPIFQEVAILQGENIVSGTRGYTNRLELLNRAADLVDYRFWVTGVGDIVFEFPQYDFNPVDYGTWENVLTYDHHVLDDRLDEEGGNNIPTVLVAAGSVTGRADIPTEDLNRYNAEGSHVVVWCPALVARLGVNPHNVTFARVTSKERLLQLAYMAMQKRMAIFTQYSMTTCYRPWVLPNKPVFNKYRSKYALTETVTHTIPVTAGGIAGNQVPQTALGLNYVRSIDVYGVPRYVTGGPSMPIFFGERRGSAIISSLSAAASSVKTFLSQVESRSDLLTKQSLAELRNAYGAFLPTGQDRYNVIDILPAETGSEPVTAPNAIEELNAAAVAARTSLNELQNAVDNSLTESKRKKAIASAKSAIDKLLELFKKLNTDYQPQRTSYGLMPAAGVSGFRHDDYTENADTPITPKERAPSEDKCELDRFPYSSPLGRATSDLSYGGKTVQSSADGVNFPRCVITEYNRPPTELGSKVPTFMGVDFLAKTGERVYACADGIVTHVQNTDKLGKVVRIQHAGGIVTTYGPLNAQVSENETVTRNQVIGTVGPMTARSKLFDSPTSMLHFQMGQIHGDIIKFYDPASPASVDGGPSGVPLKTFRLIRQSPVEKNTWENNKVLIAGSLAGGAFGRELQQQLENLKATVSTFVHAGGTPGGYWSRALTHPDNMRAFKEKLSLVKPDVTFIAYGAFNTTNQEIQNAMSDISVAIAEAGSQIWWVGPPAYDHFNPDLELGRIVFDQEGPTMLGDRYRSSLAYTHPQLNRTENRDDVTPTGARLWVNGILQTTYGVNKNDANSSLTDSVSGSGWEGAVPPEDCPPSRQRSRTMAEVKPITTKETRTGGIIVGGNIVPCPGVVKTWEETGMKFTSPKGNRKLMRAVVLHWTGGEGGGEQVFHTLNQRNLSVHFTIAQDGTIYQYADAHARLVHAGYANDWSIGIEIVNKATGTPASKWPRESHQETIHGVKQNFLRFYPEQFEAAKNLTEALCRAYSLPLVLPGDSSGSLIATVINPAQLGKYKGVLGHFHLSTKKTDPGLEMLNYVCSGKVAPLSGSNDLVNDPRLLAMDEDDGSDRLI